MPETISSSEFESKKGGFDPIEQQIRIRKLLNLEPDDSDKKVEEKINELNAEAVRAFLNVIPEESDDRVIALLQDRLSKLGRGASNETSNPEQRTA